MNEVIPIIDEGTQTYCGVERRSDWHTPEDCHKLLGVQSAMDRVHRRLDAGHARMERIEANVAQVKDCIEANAKLSLEHRDKSEAAQELQRAAIAEVLEIVTALKGFFRVVGYTGNIIKWAMAIAAPVAAFWLALKGGGTNRW